jgi:molybdenum cofactor cytidylyltransferase
MFLLGDQPQVSPSVIAAVIAQFEATNAPIVMPMYGDTPANPVLFAAAFFPELADVSGDEGARLVVKRNRLHVVHVPVSLQQPPQDVYTEEDYACLLELMKRQPTL